ncbi:MAG: putative lipid II flippase FtsW [Clostridia bacterium]|nr:putative lipid II flippase FtsW [Clostridia bacterium]
MSQTKIRPNYIVIACVFLLVTVGLVFIYSASNYSAQKDFGNPYYFVTKQFAGALVGAVAMACCTFIPVSTLKKFAVPTYLFSLVLLALVFVPGIGIENYGAKRWIGFGGFSLQPSEIAKFALVLVCSLYMSKNPSQMSGCKGIAVVSLLGVAVCLLVILEPNMSITMCVALVTFAMLFVGGVKIKHVVLCLLPLVLAVPLLIVAEPYRLARLMAYLDPWASPKGEGYQLIQSFYALGSGGWFGVGFFNSRQKFDFLPFAESDFIFAVIGEEIGFIGCIFVLSIFVVLVYQGFKIAKNANSRFECYLASGISCVIAIQTLLNVAVVTGTIPPTGLPLPFISSGGSSLMVFMASTGLLLGIDKNSKKHQKTVCAIQ